MYWFAVRVLHKKLSGALFPIENTPEWMQIVSNFDPLSYGIDGIRNSLGIQGNVSMLADGLVLAGFCAGLIMVESLLFKRSSVWIKNQNHLKFTIWKLSRLV